MDKNKNKDKRRSSDRRPIRDQETAPGYGNKKMEGPDRPST